MEVLRNSTYSAARLKTKPTDILSLLLMFAFQRMNIGRRRKTTSVNVVTVAC